MSLAIGFIVLLVFVAYAAYEIFGGRIKLAVKSFIPIIRVAAVGVVVIILLYLYSTDSGMFMSVIEAIAPTPVTRAMNVINRSDNNSNNNDDNNTSEASVEPRIKRSVSAAKKKRVVESQNWICAMCDETLDETHEIDHVIELCDGGSNDDSNLRALCRRCHARKTKEERRAR
jgi:hypothetical protein